MDEQKKRTDVAYDPETGLPVDKEYLERGLPPYLQTSLENMKNPGPLRTAVKRITTGILPGAT